MMGGATFLRGDGRALWGAAFLLAAIAYVLIMTRYEGRIADATDHSRDIEILVDSARVFVAAEPRVQRRRDDILARMRAVTAPRTRAQTTGGFLERVQQLARRDHVTVSQMTHGGEAAVVRATAAAALPKIKTAAGAPSAPHPVDLFVRSFVQMPFEMRMTGKYNDLVRAVSDLSRMDVLARVDRASFASAGDNGLQADISLVVFRPVQSAAAPTRPGAPAVVK